MISALTKGHPQVLFPSGKMGTGCCISPANALCFLRTRSSISTRSGVRGFDAYPKRQFVTEFININSLVDDQICPIIRKLPANLPEPSSTDRRPLTGVTWFVSDSDLHVCAGVRVDNVTWCCYLRPWSCGWSLHD